MLMRLAALVVTAGVAVAGLSVVPSPVVAAGSQAGVASVSSGSDVAASCREQARCPYYLYDYGDRQDGAFGANMEYSTLSDNTPGMFNIKIYGFEFTKERLNAMTVWFDVSKRNAGPEYYLQQRFAADGDGHSGRWMAKVDTWGWNGRSVTCAKSRTRVDYARDVISLTMPRRCLNSPSKVRWSPTTWRLTRYDDDGTGWGTADGAPYYQHFASWWTGSGGCGCRTGEVSDSADRPASAASGSPFKRGHITSQPSPN